MTTKEILSEDLDGLTTILCAFEGIGDEIPDKAVVRAVCRAQYHIIEYILRGKVCSLKDLANQRNKRS